MKMVKVPRGPKSAVPPQKVESVVLNFKLYDANKCLKTKKDKVWKDISKSLDNLMSEINVYHYVRQDRHNVLSNYNKIHSMDENIHNLKNKDIDDELSDSEDEEPIIKRITAGISFNISITKTQWTKIKPVKKSWTDGRVVERLQHGWTSVIRELIWMAAKLPCSFSFRGHCVNNYDYYVKATGYCIQCGAIIKLSCLNIPKSTDCVMFNIKTEDTRGIPHIKENNLKETKNKKNNKKIIYSKRPVQRREKTKRDMVDSDEKLSDLCDSHQRQGSKQTRRKNLQCKPKKSSKKIVEHVKKSESDGELSDLCKSHQHHAEERRRTRSVRFKPKNSSMKIVEPVKKSESDGELSDYYKSHQHHAKERSRTRSVRLKPKNNSMKIVEPVKKPESDGELSDFCKSHHGDERSRTRSVRLKPKNSSMKIVEPVKKSEKDGELSDYCKSHQHHDEERNRTRSLQLKSKKSSMNIVESVKECDSDEYIVERLEDNWASIESDDNSDQLEITEQYLTINEDSLCSMEVEETEDKNVNLKECINQLELKLAKCEELSRTRLLKINSLQSQMTQLQNKNLTLGVELEQLRSRLRNSEFANSNEQEFENLKYQEFENTQNQDFENSQNEEFENSQNEEFENSQIQEFDNSQNLEIENSQNQEFLTLNELRKNKLVEWYILKQD